MEPVLGREIVERQKVLPVLAKTLYRARIFRAVLLQGQIERLVCRLSALRHPNLVQRILHLRLHRLRQLVQHIGRLVNPAALVARLGVRLRQNPPETQRSVTNGELRTFLRTRNLLIVFSSSFTCSLWHVLRNKCSHGVPKLCVI